MKIVLNISFLLLGLLVGLGNVLAQTSVPTIRWNVESVRNGGAVVGTNTIVLQERARTYISGNSTLQSASVSISRSSTTATNPVNIRYSCEYFTVENLNFQTLAFSGLKLLPNISVDIRMLPEPIVEGPGCPQVQTFPEFPKPIPVAINGFQGDLNPIITIDSVQPIPFNTTSANNLGPIVFGAGETSATLSFTARFSDQIYQSSKRTSGRQGVRVAIIRLLPSTEIPPTYKIEPGKDSIKVFLLDPVDLPPVLVHSILSLTVETPRGIIPTTGAISLESDGCNWANNIPNGVFYDDNYDLLNYTVISSDSNVVKVRIAKFDTAIRASPMLIYEVLPGARAGTSARITLIGRDGTVQSDGQARLATAEFYINIVGSFPTSAATDQESTSISVAPNPTADVLSVSGMAEISGQMLIRIMDSAGRIILTKSSLATAGVSYKETFDVRNVASGMYLVEVENGGIKHVQKVIKQ